jgi:hypothetical protein
MKRRIMCRSQWNRQPDKADLFHDTFVDSWDATFFFIFSRSRIRRGMPFWLLFILVSFRLSTGNVYRLVFFLLLLLLSGLMFCGVFTTLAERHWTPSGRGVCVDVLCAVCWHQLAFDECSSRWIVEREREREKERGEALPRCVLIASTFRPSFAPSHCSAAFHSNVPVDNYGGHGRTRLERAGKTSHPVR